MEVPQQQAQRHPPRGHRHSTPERRSDAEPGRLQGGEALQEADRLAGPLLHRCQHRRVLSHHGRE